MSYLRSHIGSGQTWRQTVLPLIVTPISKNVTGSAAMLVALAVTAVVVALTASPAGAGPLETLASVHADLRTNFTFIRQGSNDRPRLASGFAPFSGDCDDLAFAAYGRLRLAGLRPAIWIVKQDYAGGRHMITCAAGKCIDTDRHRLTSKLRLRLEYSQWQRARASEAWIERQLALRSR
ncbi:hypothetical protein FKG94_18160 [Exilibacterium tricleocarpae]|uniref:Transglutaminase-like domain-containing protein n=1 Tax=Exilibacterium tricleocarpae TaxID=2591008 RepID=A0A545T606_9GAMM|nr:hypothetical protein [Exilibacterium tricleocarpae]TQV72618.1 hypothetical protein FKG94_18160 [Exilibacterium tricleocarpae]